MRVVTLKDIPAEDLGEATPIEGWDGGPVTRSRQTIIAAGDSENYNCSVVNFSHGSTTGWHTHDCDQILVVTHGNGIVADESKECEIGVGDVVHIKAGEKHWHGASKDGPMTHVAVNLGDTTTWLEPVGAG